MVNKIISLTGGLLLVLCFPFPSKAFSCWAKPHEPEAVVVGKIVEIKSSRGRLEPVVYVLATDAWLKGTPTATITLEVNNNFQSDGYGCSIPFVGEVGEVWAFQSFESEGDSYIFSYQRGIRLSNSEGEVVRQIPRPAIELYEMEKQPKGSVYQSKLDFKLKQLWRSLKNLRSIIH